MGLETVLAKLDWLAQMAKRLLGFRHPLIYGTLPNPGWTNKDELLVAFKLPRAIADQLAAFSATIGVALPGTMVFDWSAIHSTIAVIRIPEEARDILTLRELSEIAERAVMDVMRRWLETSPDPLLTRYPNLQADQKAIMAWPEEVGILYDLRTAILEELKVAIWGISSLAKIEIRPSWAEHITLCRFARVWTTEYYRLYHDLREALEKWQPTDEFAMSAVELSFVSSEAGTIRLDPIVIVDLPSTQPTRA